MSLTKEIKLDHNILSQAILEDIAREYANENIFNIKIFGNHKTLKYVSGYEEFRYRFDEPVGKNKPYILSYITDCGVKINFFYNRHSDTILVKGER